MENNNATPYTDLTRGISAELAKLRTEMPDTLRGFSALAKGATQDGALDKKTKELIAIALSVAGRCDPCIGFHVQTYVQLGGTRAELADFPFSPHVSVHWLTDGDHGFKPRKASGVSEQENLQQAADHIRCFIAATLAQG